MINLQKENPTNKAIQLKKSGIPFNEISKHLEAEGVGLPYRQEAINQANIASAGYPHDDTKINDEDNIPTPSTPKQNNVPDSDNPTTEEITSLPAGQETQSYQQQKQFQEQKPQRRSQPIPEFTNIPSYQSNDPTQIQALIESIIEEKWKTFIEDLGSYNAWKEKTETQIRAIKQEIVRAYSRFEIVEKSVMGKVKEYDQNVTEFSTDIKALSKVFQKILEPLRENINELSRITKELKK